MARTKMYATGSFRYGTRMLQAGDPVTLSGPDARLYTALGRVEAKRPRKAKVVPVEHGGDPPVEHGDELAALRAEYLAKFDKRPFYGWDADTLREKIAEA